MDTEDTTPVTGKAPAAPRVEMRCRIGMKTFGTRHYVNVVSKNISASGLLLKVDDPKATVPFQTKTLLELVFYPDGEFITEEMCAMGVVVRSVENQEAGGRKEEFGVRIVEAPDAFQRAVDQFLARQ